MISKIISKMQDLLLLNAPMLGKGDVRVFVKGVKVAKEHVQDVKVTVVKNAKMTVRNHVQDPVQTLVSLVAIEHAAGRRGIKYVEIKHKRKAKKLGRRKSKIDNLYCYQGLSTCLQVLLFSW